MKIPFFEVCRALGARERELIGKCSRQVEFRPGTRINKKPGAGLFILRNGEVDMLDPSDRPLHTLVRDNVFCFEMGSHTLPDGYSFLPAPGARALFVPHDSLSPIMGIQGLSEWIYAGAVETLIAAGSSAAPPKEQLQSFMQGWFDGIVLSDLIQSLCTGSITATLHLITGGSTEGAIQLRAGHLVAARYRGLQGIDGLNEALLIDPPAERFIVARESQDLSTTPLGNVEHLLLEAFRQRDELPGLLAQLPNPQHLLTRSGGIIPIEASPDPEPTFHIDESVPPEGTRVPNLLKTGRFCQFRLASAIRWMLHTENLVVV